MTLPIKPKTIILIIILIGLSGVALTNIKLNAEREKAQFCKAIKVQIRETSLKPLEKKVGAKSAYAYDFTNEKLIYAYNEDEILPLASLTKLMTVRVAMEKHSPDELITITEQDLLPLGSIGMQVGETYTYRDLVKAALIASSNDAASTLARATGRTFPNFYSAMNEEAQKLGLSSLTFQSSSGLDIDDTIPTATGTAGDILKLLHKDFVDFPELMKLSTASKETIRATNGASYSFDTTNELVGRLPLLVAGKTGYTLTAGGNLAVLWNTPDGTLFGASVLGSSQDGRFTDILALRRATNVLIESERNITAVCGE